MIDLKKEIAKSIAKLENIEIEKIEEYMEVPKEKNNGDYSLPCFKLAKELKKSPVSIADEIKNRINISSDIVEKIESVNGYLNFYVNSNILIKEVIEEFNKEKENFGNQDIGKGKNVIVEYSSPNIAKPFHIGHLRTTLIGRALYNIYKTLGFNTIGINHLGDYGTQFGKMIEGYKRWGNEYDLSTNPIEKLEQMYVRINTLCKEDESVLEQARENFRLLENGDKYCGDIWEKFKELSLKEFDKIYEILNIKFDVVEGEAFFAKRADEVIEVLEKSGKLQKSNGAEIVDLTEDGINVPCIIRKSNGSTIYASRDLATIIYRAKTYNYDKNIYVVGNEQKLYFEQIFKVAKYLGLEQKYVEGLEHVWYGMVRLTTGRMSTREGNVIKVKELLDESISRVKDIMKERDIENKEEVAKKVGIGAVIFNDLFGNRIKDEVFDWNEVLNFNGETGPYCQYITVRCKSVLEKAKYLPEINTVKYEYLKDAEAINVIKTISNFKETLVRAMQKNEPSILTKYIIELAENYSNFYNNNQIICEDKEIQNSRLYLTYMTKIVLEKALNILGIEVPDKM